MLYNIRNLCQMYINKIKEFDIHIGEIRNQNQERDMNKKWQIYEVDEEKVEDYRKNADIQNK